MASRSYDSAPLALCMGGLDPSGGAGLLKDVSVLSALGVHAMAIPLAETIQNGLACHCISKPAIDPLARLESLAPHLQGKWGLKLSMCALDCGDLSAILERIQPLRPALRIWDPILAPSLGVSLHDPSQLRAMAALVLKSGDWLVCPNLPEACALQGVTRKPGESVDPIALAGPLLDMGARAVWLKGGHSDGPWIEDFWIDASGAISLGRHRRLEGERRGTGCFLASAWLGLRLTVQDDIGAAKEASRLLRKAWNHPAQPGNVGRPCLAPEVL